MKNRGSNRANGFLILVSAALAVQVVLLSVKNRTLRAELAASSTVEAAAPTRARLEIGDVFEPFRLRGVDSETERRVDFESWATLLLVFAQECSACPLVYPDWEELVEPFERVDVPVLGLRLDPPDSTAETEATSSHSFAVHKLVDAREVPLAELATVPLTALLDDAGTVLWFHYGPLTDELREELLAFAGT